MVIVDNSPEAKKLNEELLAANQEKKLAKQKELAELEENNRLEREGQEREKAEEEAKAKRQQEEFEAAKAHAEKN